MTLEINGRKKLDRIFKKAKIKNYFITKIVTYKLADLFIVFEYVEFETLEDILKKDSKKFRQIVIKFYREIFFKLIKVIKFDEIFYGDISLNDMGYKDGIFYFYDIEKDKTLIRVIVDLYSKLILKYYRFNDSADKKFMFKLINEIKKMQKEYLDQVEFNYFFKKRLHSQTLRDGLKGYDLNLVYNKFRY